MLFGHGSDRYKYDKSIKIDFSSNVWYESVPSSLLDQLKYSLKDLVHYPSPDAIELSKVVAKNLEIHRSMILPTNGATEAFYLVAQLFSDKKSYVVYPSFAEYEDAAKVYKHTIQYIYRSELTQTIHFEEESMVWIGNPNNPDGDILPYHLIEYYCQKFPKTIFVVDEAYDDLFYGFKSVYRLTLQYDNLVVVKSMTKTFSIPGIRLGYLICNSILIEKFKDIKMPWSVNSLAISAGVFLWSTFPEYLPNKQRILEESRFFQNQLSSIEDLQVIPSLGNYFLLKLFRGSATELKKYLLDKHRILIRNASNFRGLNDSYFRLSLRSPEENSQLIKGLIDYFKLVQI